jgi:hypothetical protein
MIGSRPCKFVLGALEVARRRERLFGLKSRSLARSCWASGFELPRAARSVPDRLREGCTTPAQARFREAVFFVCEAIQEIQGRKPWVGVLPKTKALKGNAVKYFETVEKGIFRKLENMKKARLRVEPN